MTTAISLFKNILNCVGSKSKEGKSKDGVKVYTVINKGKIVPKPVLAHLKLMIQLIKEVKI